MEKCVLFDMDGVIVDSMPVLEAAVISFLAEHGVYAKQEDFKPYIGAGEDKYIGSVAQKYGLVYKPEMKERVYDIYLDMIPKKLKAFKGTHKLLDELNGQGIKMALATSADLIKVHANLKTVGISESLFSVIVCGEDVINKKPAPDIFLLSAKKLNASGEQCLVIEDSTNGIKAAKNAGMSSLAIASSFSIEILEMEDPDYICDNINEAYISINRFLI
jgi:beta-phosphoglucomutase